MTKKGLLKLVGWVVKLPVEAKLKISETKPVKEGDLIFLGGKKVEKSPLPNWFRLSAVEKQKLKEAVVAKTVEAGQVLWQIGVFRKKKVVAPMSGLIVGIDEFGNVEYQNEIKEGYLSPVNCGKVKIEKNKVVLKLKTEEIRGRGLNKRKAWGVYDGQVVKQITDINLGVEGEAVMVVGGDESILAKAEALGAKGFILVEGEGYSWDECEAEVPLIVINQEEGKRLLAIFKKYGRRKLWLNAVSGRILVVLE